MQNFVGMLKYIFLSRGFTVLSHPHKEAKTPPKVKE